MGKFLLVTKRLNSWRA